MLVRAYVRACVRACVCACACACVCVCASVCTCVCMCSYERVYVSACLFAWVRVRMCARVVVWNAAMGANVGPVRLAHAGDDYNTSLDSIANLPVSWLDPQVCVCV